MERRESAAAEGRRRLVRGHVPGLAGGIMCRRNERCIEYFGSPGRSMKERTVLQPPAIVTDGTGARVQFDGVTQWQIAWADVREVAIETHVVLEVDYSEAFWHLTGEGLEFVAPVEIIVGAEDFNATVFALPGFDLDSYRKARRAEAESRISRFVCWRAGSTSTAQC